MVRTASFTVDLALKKVYRDGVEVHLTPTEWGIQEILARSEGLVVSQQHLLREVWGDKHITETHYLRVYLAQLRRKIEPVPTRPQHLLTEPGVATASNPERVTPPRLPNPFRPGRGHHNRRCRHRVTRSASASLPRPRRGARATTDVKDAMKPWTSKPVRTGTV